MARGDELGGRILAWLRGQTADMVALLEELARAESPTLVAAAQRDALAIMVRELEQLDFAVRLVDRTGTGPHLYARPLRRIRGAPRQLLVGHIDTVWPIGTLERMPVRVVGERLHGPGVYDMKGGLVLLVFALRALRQAGVAPVVEPVVLVNSDEEAGSRTSTRWIRLLAAGAERAFVLEPAQGASGMLKTRRKGLGRFELVVGGGGAPPHASTPEEGVSAILELSHQIQRLFALNDPERGITVNVGTIDGGLRPNVVAPAASALVDVRVPTAADAEAIEAAIRALQPVGDGISLHVRGSFGRLPMEENARNTALFDQAASLAERIGLSVAEAPMVGGGSDANTTSRCIATLDGLGPVGGGAHATDEHVVVPSLPERAALLALLVASPVPERRAVASAGARTGAMSGYGRNTVERR